MFLPLFVNVLIPFPLRCQLLHVKIIGPCRSKPTFKAQSLQFKQTNSEGISQQLEQPIRALQLRQ
jgi:hypothetical protein